MNLAPIQSYEGPVLDVAGNFAEGQKSALMKEEMGMLKEDRARKQQGRDMMGGILSQMGDDVDYEKAAAQMLTVDPEMAGTLLQMQNSKLTAQKTQADIANERIKAAKEKIQFETKLGQGALTALNGVEEPSQKQRIWSLYMKSVKEQGVDLPDELNSGWTPENEENLKGLVDIGQMMIALDPSEMTAEQRNYEMGKRDPEFREYEREMNSGDISGTEAIVAELRKEDQSLSYSDALAIAQGLARKGQTIEGGKVVNREGLTESVGEVKAAEAEGTTTGTAMGEAVNQYDDFVAALPGLEQTSEDLIRLGQAATYNWSGKAKDTVMRELGVEVGSAAEARAELETTVHTEVLPLLKPTFGAQFTVKEGEWLITTLGDPNKSPEEKRAQIRARVKGWQKEGERLAKRTGKEVPEGMFENVSEELGLNPELDAKRARLEELRKKAGR